MLLTDEEIVKLLDIKPNDRILDIGGSMTQHESIIIDSLADIIRPEEAPYQPSELKAKNFVKVDITKDKLPFKDKEFDIVLCTHTLEDLPNPFLVMDEMSRVAKKGLIVTPSMGFDMEFTEIDFTDWLTGARRVPGQAHHKWFFVKENDGLKVIPKNFPILYTSDFQITDWSGEKEMIYIWSKKIEYKEFLSLNIHSLIDEYIKFIKSNRKYIKKGRVLFFIDNPIAMLKALLKLLLKRGSAYSHRKSL